MDEVSAQAAQSPPAAQSQHAAQSPQAANAARAPQETSAPVPGPLSGLLVADFSRVLAGPYCTMILGDLGAEIIKVEGPGGDDTRHWMPPVRQGVSTYYLSINRNKRSIKLNLKDEADRAMAAELARRADILVENFKPGGLRQFGLDYDAVRAANPSVIYASITGFGSGGGAHLPGYDLIVEAMSGLMSLQGDADGPPYRAGIAIFDVMSGLQTTIGVLAALDHRRRTGQGQLVEVNLLATALAGMVNQTGAYASAGVVPHRMGNSHPSLFPYEPLPTLDGDLVVAAGNDAQFRSLCTVLGVPELGTDQRFATNSGRTAHRDQLRPLLVERLKQRTAAQWFDDLIAAGVPCGPINSVAGGVAFAEQIGLAPVVTAGQGDRAVPGIRNPLTFSATASRYDLPPPDLDEHGDQIRAWLADGGSQLPPPPR
jgi:crotonobetainyl-CoA:carnitine CoA-transferase CaiB-like acyl-CoA transferase